MLSLGISSAEKFWQPISRHTEKYFDLVININNTYKKITNWKTDKRGKYGKYQRQLQHCCSKPSYSVDRQDLLKALPAFSCACFPRQDILAMEFINSKAESEQQLLYLT